MSDERARLLGLTADYFLANGVLELRLRTLGTAIGSSHRVLLYYFGTKAQLVTDALAEAARKASVRDSELARPHRGGRPASEELVSVWQRVSAPSQLAVIRLFFQVVALAIYDSDLYADFLDELNSEWAGGYSAFIQEYGMPPHEANELASEIIAMQRGLQFELAIGGSHSAVDRSFATAAQQWGRRIESFSSALM